VASFDPTEPEGGDHYQIVLIRDGLESVVFTGDLRSCEDWLALNGDSYQDGYFEIRLLPD
jgi:hypothetical protein